MAVVFGWVESEMKGLVASCDSDESTPIILRHFKPGDHLLEAGCGSGRWLRFLQDRGYVMSGLELNAQAVAMTHRVWSDVNVVCGDCEASPFPDNFFDGVLSFGVIEHWTDGPQKPLADIYRTLKPGGKAFISVPCHNTVRRIRRMIWLDELFQAPRAIAVRLLRRRKQPLNRFSPHKCFAVAPAWGPFFEYRMTPAEFRREVETAGFTVLEHEPLARIDGVYHDLNFLGLLMKWNQQEWRFETTGIARALNRWLCKYPFAHPHMQVIMAQKPTA